MSLAKGNSKGFPLGKENEYKCKFGDGKNENYFPPKESIWINLNEY